MLPETDSHKHLDLILSKSCTWANHIQEIASKAWVRLNLMRTLKFRVSRKSIEQIYVSFIRPLLEYCDVVWDNCSAENKKQLELIHIEAARIITGATRLCSIKKLFSELGWESLQSHRNEQKLTIFFKILNGFTPNYLVDLVPLLIQETTRYNLRNANDIQTIHTNSNPFYNSLFPATIPAWNNLSDETKETTFIASFKFRLTRNISKPQNNYNTGSRKGQTLHSRMRIECSSLNSHLFRKNIVASVELLKARITSSSTALGIGPQEQDTYPIT